MRKFILLIFIAALQNSCEQNHCITNLRDTDKCLSFLQGIFYYNTGGQYTGTTYLITIQGSHLKLTLVDNSNSQSEELREGDFFIDKEIQRGVFGEHDYRLIKFTKNDESFLDLAIGQTRFDGCGVLCFMRNPKNGYNAASSEDYFTRRK